MESGHERTRRSTGPEIEGTTLGGPTSARAESTRCASSCRRSASAHLYSPGEHDRDAGTRCVDVGSPPLARRAPQRLEPRGMLRRLTSARAERTHFRACFTSIGAAHLRSRGEHGSTVRPIPQHTGSPPLARRALRVHHRHASAARLTSARAESTSARRGGRDRPAVHLRSRGEHGSTIRPIPQQTGSPPLARRALSVPGVREGGHRLTSARAESTAPYGTAPRARTAHLRSRGEHNELGSRAGSIVGSPLLARRAPVLGDVRDRVGRLTSARAESTWTTVRPAVQPPAHLRSRGEHNASVAFFARPVGSPPLARRARQPRRRPCRPGRLTSARAESTGTRPRTWARSAAHLRSRGEHRRPVSVPASLAGSPPLARKARSRSGSRSES